MKNLLRRFMRKMGALPKVDTREQVFERLREVVFTLNHIVIASSGLSHEHTDKLRNTRDAVIGVALSINRGEK